ncbi:MAG: sigma-70 family RNA polymerase sigma factor [Phycisphaerales bacterium]|nr:sigma-70 family RNA polymerase sigma factor [Phycisphaerales bacterium]
MPRPAAQTPASPPSREPPTLPEPKNPSPASPGADPANQEDLALVAAVRRQEPDAWRELLDRYQARLFNVCLRMVRNRDLAEDMAQESMVKIIQGLGSYDGRSKLSTWMIRVTMNVCLSKLRSEKVRRHLSLEGVAERAGRGSGQGGLDSLGFSQEREPATASRVQHAEEQARVLAALDLLEPDQKAILVLRDLRGLDYEQIAQALDLALGTVKSRISRAREALYRILEEQKQPGRQSENAGPAGQGSGSTGSR